MKHHRTAITGILVLQTLLFGVPSAAQGQPVTVETVDTESTDWTDCLRLLRLDEEIAERGTYKIRMVKCVNSKITSREVGDIDREHRLTIRARNVRDALRSGRLGTARSVDLPDAAAIEERRIVPTTYFHRYRTNVTTPKSPTTVSRDRPSRRSIQKRALQQTRASRQTESEIYQDRWQHAIDSCDHITNHFHRSNCIRTLLRQTQR